MATLRRAFRLSETKTVSLLSSNLPRAVSLLQEAGLVETEWAGVLRERNVTSLSKAQVLLYLVEKEEDGYERLLAALQRHHADGNIFGIDKALNTILGHTANPEPLRKEWEVPATDTRSRRSRSPGRPCLDSLYYFHSCNYFFPL